MLTRLFPFHNLVDKWLRQKVPYTWLHSLIIAILFFGSLCLFVIPAELYSREASNNGLLVHNATDTESQKYFSDRAGMKTSIVQSMSRDNDRWSLKKNHSYNQQSAPLIRPEDFANLEKPILFAYQVGICRIEKSYWFKNSEMSHLLEGDR